VPVGTPTSREPEAAETAYAGLAQPVEVRVRWGPREGWFERAGRGLVEAEFTVDTESNRVALRLDGRAVRRLDDRELPSEGIVTGAVQVPADGRPLVFLNDHPVTGGYPVVAVVEPTELGRLSQMRPGDRLRFHAS
jgi:allophanate hydrolase subunit 2